MIPPPRTPCAQCRCCQAQTWDEARPVCLPCRDGEPCVYARNRDSLPVPEWTFPEPKAKRGQPFIVPKQDEYSRPRKVTEEKRAEIIGKLERGASVAEVAAACGLSVFTVYKIRGESGDWVKA